MRQKVPTVRRRLLMQSSIAHLRLFSNTAKKACEMVETSFLSGGNKHSYITLWILSLILGLTSCLLIGCLVPLAYHPQFAVNVMQAASPFYHGMEKSYALAKANLEHDRKMFVRHALERRKNVSHLESFQV